MTLTINTPTSICPTDPTVGIPLMMSPAKQADDGAFTWTTKDRAGRTTRYCTNIAGQGIFYWTEAGWAELVGPAEFTVRESTPMGRRALIEAFFTNEGFEVTSGYVLPDPVHPLEEF